jgi:hypothetical protein
MKKLNWTFIITWTMISIMTFLFWRAVIKFLYESIV